MPKSVDKGAKANMSSKNSGRGGDLDSNTSVSPIGTPTEHDQSKFNFDVVLQKINDGLGKGEPKLESMNTAIRLILTSLKEVTNALHSQSESYASLIKENQNQTKLIEKLAAEIGECKAVNKALKVDNDDLSIKINSLEQYSKN